MTIMDSIRRNGSWWLIGIAFFFGISILGGFGVGNFASSVQNRPSNTPGQQAGAEAEDLAEQLPAVAEIDGREIETEEFQNILERTQQQRQGGSANMDKPVEYGQLMQQVLDQMFTTTFLVKYGEENGVEVTDRDAREQFESQVDAQLQSTTQDSGDPHIFRDIQNAIRNWQGRGEAKQQVLARADMDEREYVRQLKRGLQAQRGQEQFLEDKRETLKQQRLDSAESLKQQINEGELSWEEAVEQRQAEQQQSGDQAQQAESAILGERNEPIGHDTFSGGGSETDSVYQDLLKPKPEEGTVVGPLHLGTGIFLFRVNNWIEIDPEEIDEYREELEDEIREAEGLSSSDTITDEHVLAYTRQVEVDQIRYPANFQEEVLQDLQEAVDEAEKIIHHPFINAYRAQQGMDDLSPDAVAEGREFTAEQKTEMSIESGAGGGFEIRNTTKPRYNEAVQFMEEALELQPNNTQYLLFQANLYRDWQQAWEEYDAATQTAEGSESGDDGDAVPAATEGESAQQGGGEEAAPEEPWNGRPEMSDEEITRKRLNLLEKASQTSDVNTTYNPYVNFELAKIYHERDEVDKARQQLKDAIDFSGRDEELLTSAKEIAEEREFTELVESANNALEIISRSSSEGGQTPGRQIQMGGEGSGGIQIEGGGGQGGQPPVQQPQGGQQQQAPGQQDGSGSIQFEGGGIQTGESGDGEDSSSTGESGQSGQQDEGEADSSNGEAESDEGESETGDGEAESTEGETESGEGSESAADGESESGTGDQDSGSESDSGESGSGDGDSEEGSADGTSEEG